MNVLSLQFTIGRCVADSYLTSHGGDGKENGYTGSEVLQMMVDSSIIWSVLIVVYLCEYGAIVST